MKYLKGVLKYLKYHEMFQCFKVKYFIMHLHM